MCVLMKKIAGIPTDNYYIYDNMTMTKAAKGKEVLEFHKASTADVEEHQQQQVVVVMRSLQFMKKIAGLT
jgi:phosphopantetheinyl transferase (holo-ACP synthase)